MDKKKKIDWEKIEVDYRAGVKTLREIAEEHGITHAYVKKRAKCDGWERDLTAKIKAKAKLQKDEVDPLDKSGFVYVIYIDDSAENRYFKIGMASSFNIRFGSHQCASPFDICVACVYFVPNMRVEERILHTMFAEKKVRGEWFKLDTNDLRVIASRSLIL